MCSAFCCPVIRILSLASLSPPTVTVIRLLYLSVTYCVILVHGCLLCGAAMPLHCPLSPSYVISIMLLNGVIHLVRTHDGGEGGQANAYECVQGGRGVDTVVSKKANTPRTG